MRRSSIWFLIALLWLIDAALTAFRHGVRPAVPAALVTIVFVALGLIMRARESRNRPTYRFK